MGEVFVINTLFNSHWELGGRNTTSLLAASLLKSCFSHAETRIVCVCTFMGDGVLEACLELKVLGILCLLASGCVLYYCCVMETVRGLVT